MLFVNHRLYADSVTRTQSSVMKLALGFRSRREAKGGVIFSPSFSFAASVRGSVPAKASGSALGGRCAVKPERWATTARRLSRRRRVRQSGRWASAIMGGLAPGSSRCGKVHVTNSRSGHGFARAQRHGGGDSSDLILLRRLLRPRERVEQGGVALAPRGSGIVIPCSPVLVVLFKSANSASAQLRRRSGDMSFQCGVCRSHLVTLRSLMTRTGARPTET